MNERITKLDQFIEINGNGNIRKALALCILNLEKLRNETRHSIINAEHGGFCEKHDAVFYGDSCPLCSRKKP